MEYPLRPAFSLLTKILDEYQPLTASLPVPQGSGVPSALAGSSASNPSVSAQGGLAPAQKGKMEATLQGYLTKWQDPKQADTIMKVQKELDETKVVLVSSVARLATRQWLTGWPTTTAQDDRVGPRARREARQPRRAVERALRTVQNVLQDCQEGEHGSTDPRSSADETKPSRATRAACSCRNSVSAVAMPRLMIV